MLRIAAGARLVPRIVAEARSAFCIAAQAPRIAAGARCSVLRTAEIVFGEDQRWALPVSSRTRDKARSPADGRSNTVSVAGGTSVARRGPPSPRGRC